MNVVIKCMSPLEQFDIVSLFSVYLGSVGFTITNSTFTAFAIVASFIFLVSSVFVNGDAKYVPSAVQTVRSNRYSLIVSMIMQTIGNKGLVFVPFVITRFTFIRLINMTGMVPYAFTVTSHRIVTLTLSLMVWFGKLYIGLSRHGIKLLSMFMPTGTPFAMVPLRVPLEVRGFFITAISRSVRLFANMMAGHILLKTIAGFAWTMMRSGVVRWVAHLLPMAVLFRLFFLETGVAFVQAYVFTLRTCIYTADAINGGH
jgi:F-type H+-transporting ATPase subunit a